MLSGIRRESRRNYFPIIHYLEVNEEDESSEDVISVGEEQNEENFYNKDKEDGIYYIYNGGEGKITLMENQKHHVEELQKIWNFNRFCISASPTGSGKTFITLWLYLNYHIGNEKFKRIIICGPKSSLIVFALVANQYNIKNMQFITYSSLACKGKIANTRGNPRNIYLNCAYEESNIINKKTGDYKKKPRYQLRKSFKKLAQEGVLLVFDEFHRLKNDSAQSYACEVLSRYVAISKKASKSRAIFLSATPVQRSDNATRYLTIFGIIDNERFAVYNKSDATYDMRSFNKADQFMEKVAEKTKEPMEEIRHVMNVFRENPIGDDNGTADLAHLYYNKVIARGLTQSLIRTETEFKHIIRNRFVNIPRSGMSNYAMGLVVFQYGEKLMKMAAMSTGSARYTLLMQAFSALSMGQHLMERAKLLPIARAAKQYLKKDKNCRVLIFLWLKELGVDVIKKEFKGIPYLLLKGGLSDLEKISLVKRFQDKDGPRLLIATIQSGSESLSFHDIHGGQKRYSLISPSFDYVRIAQAAGRTNRVGVLSDSQVEYVYGCDYLFSPQRREIYTLTQHDQIPYFSNEYGIIDNLRGKEKKTGESLNINVKREKKEREGEGNILDEGLEKNYDIIKEIEDDKNIDDILSEDEDDQAKKKKKKKAKKDEDAQIEEEIYLELLRRQLPIVTEDFFEEMDRGDGDFSNKKVEKLISQGYKVVKTGVPLDILRTKTAWTTVMSKKIARAAAGIKKAKEKREQQKDKQISNTKMLQDLIKQYLKEDKKGGKEFR